MSQQAPTVSPRLGCDPDIFKRGRIGKDIGDLVRAGDPLVRNPVGGEPGYFFAIEQNASCRRAQYTRQAIEEGALARAVRSDDGADFITRDGEIDLVESGQAAKANGQILSAQQRRRRLWLRANVF